MGQLFVASLTFSIMVSATERFLVYTKNNLKISNESLKSIIQPIILTFKDYH